MFNVNKAFKFKQQTEGIFIYLDAIAFDPNDTILQFELK